MLEKVKTVLRLTTNVFDEEVTDLINAALLDLGVAGVVETDTSDPLIIRAVETYCKMHWGDPEDPARLKSSYDEQKAQLSMHSGYTEWR